MAWCFSCNDRAGIFNAIRLGVYEDTLNHVTNVLGLSQGSLLAKCVTAIPVSAISITFANPWDVIKVRCQRNSKYTQSFLFAADPRVLLKISKEEGFFRGLYSGYSANLLRNIIIGSSELVAYFHSKQVIMKRLNWADDTKTHVASSLCSGLTATVLGSPMDVLGTRLMQESAVAEGLSAPKNFYHIYHAHEKKIKLNDIICQVKIYTNFWYDVRRKSF